MIKNIAEAALPLFKEKPFAFYGHSLGAGIAFKLADYLRTEYALEPEIFYVGAWVAPHLRTPFKIIDNISEQVIMADSTRDEIYEHLRSLEIPETLLGDQSLMDTLMPGIKADILIGKNYSYKNEQPFSCPIIAFAGKADTVFNSEMIEAWQRHTSSQFEFVTIEGGHLFINERKEDVLSKIADTLKVKK